MLKIVRMPSFLRTAATCFIDGCMSGAKQKQMPSSSRQASTCGTLALMFTPSSASTSAEPLRLVMLRLPCLATGTPAAAATIAAVVLMLNSFEPPPPVPHVSSRSVPAADRRHVPPHGRGRAGDFVDRFALGRQGGEQAGRSARSVHSPRMMASMAADISSKREVLAAGHAAQDGIRFRSSWR